MQCMSSFLRINRDHTKIYSHSNFILFIMTHINLHTYRYYTTCNQINNNTSIIILHSQTYTTIRYTNLYSTAPHTQILLHNTSTKSKFISIHEYTFRIKPLLILSVVNTRHE
jgi:hypothetical protein